MAYLTGMTVALGLTLNRHACIVVPMSDRHVEEILTGLQQTEKAPEGTSLRGLAGHTPRVAG